MSLVNTGVSMKVSFFRRDYAIDVYKSMTYGNVTHNSTHQREPTILHKAYCDTSSETT